MNDKTQVCGAKIRGTEEYCQDVELYPNGRCSKHGGLSTGPRTQAGKARAAQNGVRETTLNPDPLDSPDPNENDFDRRQRELEQILQQAEPALPQLKAGIDRLQQLVDAPPSNSLIDALAAAALGDDLATVLASDNVTAEVRQLAVKAAAGAALEKLQSTADTTVNNIELARRMLNELPDERWALAREIMRRGESSDAMTQATGLTVIDIINGRSSGAADAGRCSRVLEYAKLQATHGPGHATRWFEQHYGQAAPGQHEVEAIVTEGANAGDQRAKIPSCLSTPKVHFEADTGSDF